MYVSAATSPHPPPCTSRSRPHSVGTATGTVLTTLGLTLPPRVRRSLAQVLLPLPAAPRFFLAVRRLRLLRFPWRRRCRERSRLLHLPQMHLLLLLLLLL